MCCLAFPQRAGIFRRERGEVARIPSGLQALVLDAEPGAIVFEPVQRNMKHRGKLLLAAQSLARCAAHRRPRASWRASVRQALRVWVLVSAVCCGTGTLFGESILAMMLALNSGN